MAYLMLKTGLRTIEVSRARIEHLQELVPREKWRLWVHGKGRGSAYESVQVLKEVYERMQAYLALQPGPLKGSDPIFATTACYDRGGKELAGHTTFTWTHVYDALRLGKAGVNLMTQRCAWLTPPPC